MRFIKALIAALLACASMSSFATATFDGSNVNLSAVRVGSTTYTNVRLGVVNLATYTFRLTGVDPQTSTAPADITFNTATGVLTIPAVSVGSSTYSVTLQLTDAPTYTFALNLNSVTLLPPPTTGNASACFDPAYLATGTKWELFMQTSTSGTVVSTNKTENEILGPKTFNGQNSIEEKTQLTILTGTGAGTTSESRSYFQVQAPKVLTLGAFTQISTSGFFTETTTVFNPPTEFNYSLAVGQSVTTTATGTSTTQITGTPIPIPPQVSSFSYTVTYTFLGFEDVTVPAGSFAGACKWTYVTTSQGVTETSTHWMTKKGAPLKTVAGNSVTELMPGSNVNGGPVGP